jgi:8-oxo-dGTP pyrophosphatase MutT (NUDIX family)
LLFPSQGEVRFLLTARPEDLARHPGQVSLPGGAAEPQDRDLWQTVLRETWEELGVRTGRLRPLGRLDPVPVLASNYLIVPFVAWSPTRPRLSPDPREVAEVIEVPLDALLDPSLIEEETWELRVSSWRVTFFRFGEHVVWGATARILSDLAGRLRVDSGREIVPGAVRPV